MRCNRCHRTMAGTTAYDGACACGGLIEASPRAVVLRRTFEARKHPKGSPERARLNADALTSEYLGGSRYLVRIPALMSDGTPNQAQRFYDTALRTRAEAEAYLVLALAAHAHA